MTDRDDITAWIRLLATPGVGRGAARRLLAAFGAPGAVLEASLAARRQVVDGAVAEALGTRTQDVEARVGVSLAWLEESAPEARALITLADARYPPLLVQTADPPLLLYAQGRCELLQAQSLAVVGSRNPTPQGRENAHAFAAHFSRAGVTIVSGLALGIDGAAHAGALEGASSTIAVVATGLDEVYPRRHQELAHRIAAEGLLLSEYPPGTPPLAENFPVRNRIIAGLTRGTLVVEAALQSGSLITARLAVEAGRDVFAIPGSIHSPQSRGCHALIRQGAKLVDRAEDVLEELQASSARERPADEPHPTKADPVLEALGYEPATLDVLVARTGWPAAELNVRLLDLELEGRVARLPGQLFQRLAHG